MLFGASLSISGDALFGIPPTALPSLPVISAIFALIGGIIAFNRSKWGIRFLLIALVLCVPFRDTRPYGAVYFFAMILCFFIKKESDEYQDMVYEDENVNEENNADYYTSYSASDSDENNLIPENNGGYYAAGMNAPKIDNNIDLEVFNEPPKLRRRMSKCCPTCGAIVARESRFCPTCGTALSVIPDDLSALTAPAKNPEDDTNDMNNDMNINIKNVEEQLIPSLASNENKNDNDYENVNANENDNLNESGLEVPNFQFETNFYANDGDDMSSAQTASKERVLVKPKKKNIRASSGTRFQGRDDIDEAASSYKEFSKYTRSGKKRKRSNGRKILNMLLLVSAVAGAMYCLLSLRKLEPGKMPSVATETLNKIKKEENKNTVQIENQTESQTGTTPADENIAEPVTLVVAENILPNFTPERTPKTGLIVGSNVNVREDHTTSSNRITRLNVNTRVEILGNFDVRSGQYAGIWYNIRTNGRDGWVYGRYVQPLGSGLPEGYSNALLKTFGNNRNDMINSLGQPTRTSRTSAEWAGISASFRDDNLTRIRINSANRELQNGLKVGMSQTALYQILGYPSSVSNKIMQYAEKGKNGVSVQLDRDNSISVITVNEIN